jgi:hypothetical protein
MTDIAMAICAYAAKGTKVQSLSAVTTSLVLLLVVTQAALSPLEERAVAAEESISNSPALKRDKLMQTINRSLTFKISECNPSWLGMRLISFSQRSS